MSNLYKKKKSPSISRIITEAITRFVREEKVLLVAFFLGLGLFAAVVIASLGLYHSLALQKQVRAEREKVVYQLSFWEQVVRVHPDYRDGYFMLAVLHQRMGHSERSKLYLKKAMELDPSFSEGKELEKILSK